MRALIFAILLAVVALSPLPLGSNRPIAWTVIGVVIGVLLISWGISQLFEKRDCPVKVRRIGPYLTLFFLAALWVVAQTISVFPDHFAHPLWNITAETLGENVFPAISVDPYKSGTALSRLLIYGGVFWLSLQFCRSRQNAKTLLLTITIAGFVYASYGLVIYLGDFNTILWYQKWIPGGRVSSVFVNSNSFATYIGLTLLCSIAFLQETISRGGSLGLPKNRTYRIFLENLTGQGWIFLLSIFIGISSLLLSQSRAGLISFLIGTLVLFLSLRLSKPIGLHKSMNSKKLISYALFIFTLFGAIFYVSGENTMKRLLLTQKSAEKRMLYNEQIIRAIKTEPLLGFGYGTFSNTSRMFRDESLIKSRKTLFSAHNTYLENAHELGVPAAMALFLSIGGLGYVCLRGIFTRRMDRIYSCVGLASLVLVAIHSIVDFSLQIPAVAITFASILGVACAQSWSSSEN